MKSIFFWQSSHSHLSVHRLGRRPSVSSTTSRILLMALSLSRELLSTIKAISMEPHSAAAFCSAPSVAVARCSACAELGRLEGTSSDVVPGPRRLRGYPRTPVVLDRLGNVVGTFVCTFDCFAGHGGGVLELLHSNGFWRDLTLASYWSQGQEQCEPCGVAFDLAGRLYGVTTSYESQYGNTEPSLWDRSRYSAGTPSFCTPSTVASMGSVRLRGSRSIATEPYTGRTNRGSDNDAGTVSTTKSRRCTVERDATVGLPRWHRRWRYPAFGVIFDTGR